ncbi:hypothetical protein PsYK624_040090 [Phanerochaete sordida]|uniref:DUF1766-domain-containing protein n=1 Tax=Phanerochaete sordida TaxID=48140 RepID=A0A9P3LA27_9APHY|nr:hypothetical protein PsYK624_040090 [Phanerochaete sordida]
MCCPLSRTETASSAAPSAVSELHNNEQRSPENDARAEDLASALEKLDLVASLGRGYRVGSSRPASDASPPSPRAHRVPYTPKSRVDDSDDDEETPTPSRTRTATSATPPASPARRRSAPPQPEESASYAPHATRAPPATRTVPQSAPVGGKASGAVVCGAICPTGVPCRNKTATGPFCYRHRGQSAAAPTVERVPNVYMNRLPLAWLSPQAWNRVAVEFTAPPNPRDGPGFIYIAHLEGAIPKNELHLKLGRTVNIYKRLKEWERHCPACHRAIVYGSRTLCYKRLEKIMLIILQDLVDSQAYRLPGFPRVEPPIRSRDYFGQTLTKPVNEVCQGCNTIHIEQFKFNVLLPGGKKLNKERIHSYVRQLCEDIRHHLDEHCAPDSEED